MSPQLHAVRSMSRRWWPVLVTVFPVMLAGCRETPRSAAADVPDVDVRRLPPDRKKTVPDVMLQAADRGRVLGSDSAQTELLLVMDYECPTCREWMRTTWPALRQEYVTTGRVRVTFVHYPLRVHPVAVRAASAALCASAQGKFWEATERLFDAQAQWQAAPHDGRMDEAQLMQSKARVDSLVRTSGVSGDALDACIQTGRMLRQIHLDIAYADKTGLGGVPRLYIGSRILDATLPLDSLRAVIHSTLAGK